MLLRPCHRRVLAGASFFVPGASSSRCRRLPLQLRPLPPSPISPLVRLLASPCALLRAPRLPLLIPRSHVASLPPWCPAVTALRLHRRSPSHRCSRCPPATLSSLSCSPRRHQAHAPPCFLRALPSRRRHRKPVFFSATVVSPPCRAAVAQRFPLPPASLFDLADSRHVAVRHRRCVPEPPPASSIFPLPPSPLSPLHVGPPR